MPHSLRTGFAMMVVAALTSCDSTETPLDPTDTPEAAARIHGRFLLAEADSLLPLAGWTVGGCAEGSARTSTGASGEWSIPLDSLPGGDLCYSHGDTLVLKEKGGSDTGLKVRILEPKLDLSVASTFVKDPRDGEVYRLIGAEGSDWMAQNLRRRTAGAKPPNGVGTRLAYHTGLLYSGREVLGTSKDGVCPTGWHVPTSQEWRLWTSRSTTVPLYGRALKSRLGWGVTTQEVLVNEAYCYDMAYKDPNACQWTVTLVNADGENTTGFTAFPNITSPSNTARWWVADSVDADSGLVATMGFKRSDSLALRKLPRDSLAGVRCTRS